MPKCPFKLITGLSCPGCGIQRAIHAMLHGKFTEAITYNYYFTASIPGSFLPSKYSRLAPPPVDA